MDAGLEVFAPEPRIVPIRHGKDKVEIRPLTIRQLAPMTRAAAHFMPFVLAGNWMAALATQPDAVVEAIAIGSGLSPEEVGDLPGDDLVPLAQAIWDQNQDFLLRTVAATDPILKAVAAMRAEDGATSSPGSSAGDTGSTKSSG